MDNGPVHCLKPKKRKQVAQRPEAGNQSDSSNGSDGEADTDGVCPAAQVLLFPNLESIVANLEAAAQELLDSLERPESTSSLQFLHEAMPAVEDQTQWPLIDLTGESTLWFLFFPTLTCEVFVFSSVSAAASSSSSPACPPHSLTHLLRIILSNY